MTDQPPPAPGTSVPIGVPPAGRNRPLPLRQMGIGELIDGAFRLYRLEWKVLIGIVALIVIPATFIQVWVQQRVIDQAPTVGSSDVLEQLLAVTLVFIVVELLVIQPFLVAAVARAAADIYLGEPVSIERTYRYALGRIFSILWITIISLVATLAGFILLVIPGIIAVVRLTFAPMALVVDGERGTSAISRSWRLTSGHFWRVAGALFVAGIIAAVAATILAIPGELAVQALGPESWPISALATALATVVTTPFSMLVIVLMYFDLRIRKEGFDIEVMARELATAS
jgi:hypothetical protein